MNVSRVATGLFIGIAVVAVGTLLVRRLQEVIANRDPELLLDRLANQVDNLEQRFSRVEEGRAS